jgi:threonine-phosphate decarboxylase
MERYEHGGDIYGNPAVRLDFSVNTNPLGLPDAVLGALVSRADEFARYPDPLCRELRAAIAGYEDVPADLILCGNGAADLIYRICYAVKPRRALVCAPTFSEYERALNLVGCRVTHHVLTDENEFALTDEILERLVPGVDALFLCHPNNPTGRLIPSELMERILTFARQNGTLVVADECFLDFTNGESAKKHLGNMPNLIVLKAFTKIYAMAGLRLGYMLASDPALLAGVSAAAQCWSVSVPAQIAGVAAVACADWRDKTRRLADEERRFLSESLQELGPTVFKSDANYLLLRSDRPLYEPLLQRGILIRKCENFRGLDGSYYRVGVRTRAENTSLVHAVKESLHG